MRVVGCAMVIFICMLIGRTFAEGYISRAKNLRSFIMSLGLLKSKIRYGQEYLEDSFIEMSFFTKDRVGKIFDKMSTELQKCEHPISEVWNNVIEESFNSLDFTFEDEKILIDFGALLGKTDIEGQISNINVTIERLSRQLEMAEAEKAKYAKMYRTIGGIGGTALAIVLI